MSPSTTIDRHHFELATRLGDSVLYGLFGLLMFGPLAFGAVEPWSIFIYEVVSVVLLLLWIGQQFINGQIKIRRNALFAPIAGFAALVVCQLMFRITAYPHDTKSQAFLYIAYGILCFLASQSLLRGSQARKLALILSVYGAALACLSLVQGISSNGKLYWIREPRMGGWIYGPYVNHNHYAGLMEMLIPIPLVLSLTHIAPVRGRNLAAAAAAIMVGTVFICGSRGGMLAIMSEIVLLAVFVAKQKRGLGTAIGLGIFLTIVVGLLIWVGGGELSRRIATVGPHSELGSDIRTSINRDGLRMFEKKPVLGWGLGAFPVVYPKFRSFYTNFFVNEAHDDYLQLLVETGAAGFVLMLWFVAIAYRNAIKKIGDWTLEINGATSLACLLGMTGILVHSAVDFNLQIPANAALFYVFCTVAAAPSFMQPARKRKAIRIKSKDAIVPVEEALQQSATNF